MFEITAYANERIERGKRKLRPKPEEANPNMRFVNNRFVKQLETNKQLIRYAENKNLSWTEYPEVIKSIYEELVATDYYKEYMTDATSSYTKDRDMWRKIFRKTILNNEELLSTLEDMNLYWNDDVEVVGSFVMKTIKQFEEEKGAIQPLLPMFKDDEDRDFAGELLLDVLREEKKYKELIDKYTKNWDLERIAFMDILIMQVALAELHNFPNIPVNVTLNEYIEIAKFYSTEKSGTFINGILDNIVTGLRKDNKIIKIASFVPEDK